LRNCFGSALLLPLPALTLINRRQFTAFREFSQHESTDKIREGLAAILSGSAVGGNMFVQDCLDVVGLMGRIAPKLLYLLFFPLQSLTHRFIAPRPAQAVQILRPLVFVPV